MKRSMKEIVEEWVERKKQKNEKKKQTAYWVNVCESITTYRFTTPNRNALKRVFQSNKTRSIEINMEWYIKNAAVNL